MQALIQMTGRFGIKFKTSVVINVIVGEEVFAFYQTKNIFMALAFRNMFQISIPLTTR